MAKPTNTIKKIKVGNTIYDVVPSMLTDGTYKASCPTLTADATLATTNDLTNNIKEAYLKWGGKNIAGSYAPIDACMNPVLSPNRIAGMNIAGITVEYTNDGGTTWSDYGLTDAQKKALVTTSQSIIIGKTGNKTANSKVRVTLDGVSGSVYTALNKMHIYISTNYSNGCKVTMESYDYNSSTVWHTVISDQSISGWSGWNVLNFTLPGSGAFGGTNNNTHQRKIRLTFSHTSITSGHETAGLTIYKIYAYGGVGWATPSTLAANGVPYTYDANGNITCMGELNATALKENGTTLASKYLYFTGSQSLTDAQKANARSNIGIVTNSTYDETNNKIATMNDLLDTNVKLSSELKTYYNVGKITNASGTNPVTIGNQGDSLRTVFNNLFNMDEIQPTITSNPSITTLSLSSSASDERGTSITSISYSISTSQGSYTYQPNPTGVSWSSFSLSGSGITPISGTTSKTGTITLSSAYVVGTSSAISVSCEGSYTQGNIAKTNLGNDSNPIVRIAAGTASKTANFSKTAVDYPYYGFGSSSSTAPSSKTRGNTSLESSSGQQLTYTSGNYVWIFSKTNNSNLKIMIYSDITQDWSEMLGGTTAMGSITFTKQNGVSDTFYGYRTVNTAVSGATAKIKLTTS